MAPSKTDGRKSRRKDTAKPFIMIPGEQNCQQPTLLLNHDARDLAKDRVAAKELYNKKEARQINNGAAFYRLPSMAEKLHSSPYRRSVNNNFTAHFYKWDDEFVFKYKTFCRGDKIHCADAFLDQMKCVKRKEFLKAVESKAVIDWISAVPLHVKYYRNRRSLIRPDLSLGRQPLNILCEPLLLHRVEFALNFRGDRFLSPLMIVLNWHDIHHSMADRLLWIQSQAKEKLERQIQKFVKENRYYCNARKTKSKPLRLPLAHVDPFSFWNRTRKAVKPGDNKTCEVKKSVKTFTLGSLKPHRIFDELNQFPADFPSHFHVVMALSDTRLRMTKFSSVKHDRDEERVRIQESHPNVFVEKLDLSVEDYDTPSDWVTIEPSIHEYGPAPAVTFRRGRFDDSLVAQTLIPKDDDVESLGSVSGWSTDSFASTMSETPGNYHFAWKDRLKLDHNASCGVLDATNQSINRWRAMSDVDRRIQQTTEIQERLVKASMSESKKLCRHTKNEYFSSILRRDVASKFVFFDYDQMHRKQRVEELTDAVREEEISKERASILWGTVQRLLHYYPTREFDSTHGMDISRTWTNVAVQGLLPEVVIDRLKNLIGSHDTWNDETAADSFACIPLMHVHRILKGEKRPFAESFVFDVIMLFCLIFCLVFLMCLAPFH